MEKGCKWGGGRRDIVYLTAGSHSQSLRAELRPIVGESTRGQPYSSRQMQGRMMLERIGVQSGVRDRVLTYDSMTRIKVKLGLSLGICFRSGFWVRLRSGSGLVLGSGSEEHVKRMKACPQLESVEDDCQPFSVLVPLFLRLLHSPRIPILPSTSGNIDNYNTMAFLFFLFS